jgi:hypothetical protein
MGNHGGVAGGVATAVSTIVDVLTATTAVAAVAVPMAVVVAVVTVARAAAVVLARRRQWSGQHFVGVERRRSSSEPEVSMWISSIMVSPWMWRLATMVLTYN